MLLNATALNNDYDHVPEDFFFLLIICPILAASVYETRSSTASYYLLFIFFTVYPFGDNIVRDLFLDRTFLFFFFVLYFLPRYCFSYSYLLQHVYHFFLDNVLTITF